MAITDWPVCERPRERLLQNGAAVLSDAELLAIFLRTGVKGKSAVDLARDLLKQFGSLRGLLQADREQFCAGNGLGDAKYAQLQAVLEMARRHLGEILARDDVFTSPQATRSYLSAQLRDLRNEAFVALFLDSKHRLIRFQVLFQGTVDGASVHPRVVVQRALELNAAALIIAHNHPSGIAEPSHADLHITQRLREALALVDIRLLDHLVVGDGAVISLAERGAL